MAEVKAVTNKTTYNIEGLSVEQASTIHAFLVRLGDGGWYDLRKELEEALMRDPNYVHRTLRIRNVNTHSNESFVGALVTEEW